MERQTTAYQLGTRNHLLMTPQLLCRGVVFPCAGRLGDQLRGATKPVVCVKDVEVIDVPGGARRDAEEVRLLLADVVVAHEYVALGGDPHRRQEIRETSVHEVSLTFSGVPGVWLSGALTLALPESMPRFAVLQGPKVDGHGPLHEAWRRELAGLPYVLVHRDRIEALLVPGERRS